MATQLTCDVCGEEPGIQMLTNLTDGTTMVIGAACNTEFYVQSTILLLETGQHEGPRTKCAACRILHERMTDGVTPMADVSRETSDPDPVNIPVETAADVP